MGVVDCIVYYNADMGYKVARFTTNDWQWMTIVGSSPRYIGEEDTIAKIYVLHVISTFFLFFC